MRTVQPLILTLAVALLATAGCRSTRVPKLTYLPDRAQLVPVADLPAGIRVENWVGRDVDGDSGGSCVHASTINCFRAAARDDLEAVWFANRDRGYEGPETASRIKAKLAAQNIPFVATESADVGLLEAATRTRRVAVIFYYPSHCINFISFANVGGRECAILLDNNFRDEYIVVEKQLFIRTWKYFGGFALVPWIDPVAPRTYPRAI
ncbi:hypothetical protein LOC67_23495 [Stieleria sp. JC731]|uniref:hypothetical protein n=1 Tax=Pirellulaceae TaxID=2691357 RepID=UPI001E2CA7C5|nr:hypothetical protein [Stieleria sp. JC731]MCC9603525.1 hypothetical protein [Stieleria sp. JC731]